jgi:hypothetical protein
MATLTDLGGSNMCPAVTQTARGRQDPTSEVLPWGLSLTTARAMLFMRDEFYDGTKEDNHDLDTLPGLYGNRSLFGHGRLLGTDVDNELALCELWSSTRLRDRTELRGTSQEGANGLKFWAKV